MEDPITADAGFFQVARLERKAHALGSAVGLMDGQMTPPHAPIIPQMVIFIRFIHTE
jgi:hypothetical protein